MKSNKSLKDLVVEHIDNSIEVKNIGKVLRVGDGVAVVSGLSKVGSNELVHFERTDTYGIALNIDSETVGVVLLGGDSDIIEGDIVSSSGTLPSISVGTELLGRIVNPLGKSIDNEKEIKTAETYPIEKKAPGVLQRRPVYRPLQTGIKIIDAVIPVGRGQRELIIGDRKTGKSTIILDTIISQANINRKIESGEYTGKPVYCIYCAIGQKASSVAGFINKLKKFDALKYTCIVYASADSSAAMQYLAPYSATALGEYFMNNAMDSVVFYDDLTKHAWAYRQMSLLLKRFPGREAYPGDVFYLHSRLLERSAQLSEELGGGSLTAFPVIETLEGDVSAYIPTNVISITDGQIYLDAEMYNSDIKPAVNAGTSVSRVGSAAQVKAMKKLAGKLRLTLAQYRELAAFAQFGSDLDKETLSKLERGKRLTEVLKQKPYSPMDIEKQITILFAVTNGYLDNIELVDIKKWESDLLDYVSVSEPEILSSIRSTNEISDAVEKKLRKVLDSFSTQNGE